MTGWEPQIGAINLIVADLQRSAAFYHEVFGVSPRIRCVAREQVAGITVIEEDEPAASPQEVVARLKAELDAEVEESGESS